MLRRSMRDYGVPRARVVFARARRARASGVPRCSDSRRLKAVSAFARFALFRVDLRDGCPSRGASYAYVAFAATRPALRALVFATLFPARFAAGFALAAVRFRAELRR